ncbi:hypothetical protein D3C86_211410 [compost metagenome]
MRNVNHTDTSQYKNNVFNQHELFNSHTFLISNGTSSTINRHDRNHRKQYNNDPDPTIAFGFFQSLLHERKRAV